MTIYDRSWVPITVVRLGSLEDVRRLEGRLPDEEDRQTVASGGRLVVRDSDRALAACERLCYRAQLRATGGPAEIDAAVAVVVAAARGEPVSFFVEERPASPETLKTCVQVEFDLSAGEVRLTLMEWHCFNEAWCPSRRAAPLLRPTTLEHVAATFRLAVAAAAEAGQKGVSL